MGDLHGISRIDQPSTGSRGWQVRLQNRGVRVARFFSDSQWGGEERALERAIQFRDRLVARRKDDVIRIQESLTHRNQSGVVGVSRVEITSTNGVRYASWQATWSPEPGRRKSVRFSVLRYGEDDAFRRACEARAAGIAGEWED